MTEERQNAGEGGKSGQLKIFFGYAPGVGITYAMLQAALTAEDADAALQKILSEERMAVMYIQPDGTAGEEPDDEEEMEE